MLKRLTIQNYVLIESLDIEFPAGLIIITGETGAGKSIMLGALSLLLGAKSDVSVLKDNTRNCVVEGEFEIAVATIFFVKVFDSALFVKFVIFIGEFTQSILYSAAEWYFGAKVAVGFGYDGSVY